jgi:hypothetical protein
MFRKETEMEKKEREELLKNLNLENACTAVGIEVDVIRSTNGDLRSEVSLKPIKNTNKRAYL